MSDHEMRPCGCPEDICPAPGHCTECDQRLVWDGKGGYGHESEVNPPKCLDEHQGDCSGTVEYRESLSGTGTPIPRCDHHFSLRLDRQQEIQARYGGHTAPSDFDPSYAGESWGEDY